MENTENIKDNINLDLLPKDGERVLKELAAGNMVIARSKNEFLYIVAYNNEFHMFSHTPGAPGGGQKKFPNDEKYTATVKQITELADFMYLCEFDKSLNLYGVMFTAEDGILSMFPGENRDGDQSVEFIIPGESNEEESK